MASGPLIAFGDRASDSALIERVWHSRSVAGGSFHSIATPHWEMVVSRVEGQLSLTVRGPETVASIAALPAHGEWFAIRFRLGTCMPMLPPARLSEGRAITLPGAGNRSFWLNGSAMEYPTFDNAEIFVRRLARAGVVMTDPLVMRAAAGEPPAGSVRTLERRFRQTTGLTRGTICQIERARTATLLLRRGASLMDATHATGFYDQAHLIRSLRRFIGQTPTEIARGLRQLSFLSNTGADA